MINTTWGYTLTTVSSLADFMTVADFVLYTNGRFSAKDTRIQANITGASRAIQNYCGWHIYPNLECEMVYRVQDLRDAFVGSDLLIQLPATCVNSVKSILLNAKQEGDEWIGDSTIDFDLDRSGLIRIYDTFGLDKRSKIRIVYDAGVGAEQIDVLKELVANKVTHAVTTTYGVNSETAGSVSVSYNGSWASATKSSLPDDTKEVLQAFKVKGVF